ncbi:3'(2'),5'-bisphosphate nucleotidase CysQ [Pseudomonas sp. AS2.8]|uniref:3'(2'),5'-bisphosphate nucleotidase CysQ n=1 Tax=Pseudomonas sp. AS2.8 TaxID=2587128 RepID=UPI00161F7374|nr:3'(2'),5'-bisphosphate nucleotidase CysQ [Pseudomonas sp. AS2.8]MBB2897317.1 3'(2'), 5'-bisphosphate nucleotidase [Pseudomonas sp. AS2.8]
MMAPVSITAPLVLNVIDLVRQAGAAILPHWRQGVAVRQKSDDSPVTAADLAAHRVLADGLARLTPDVPVLSEEACDIPYAARSAWDVWWVVDPLDGTKEFIDGSEEFTVNVALVERGQVIFGVVGIPTRDVCFSGGRELGAFRIQGEDGLEIGVRTQPEEAFTVVASRRHGSPAQQRLLEELGTTLGEPKLVSVGSSLKFCLLAEGLADFYPRLAPTSQWDTAAAQGVLEGAGGEVLTLDGQPLTYEMRESFLNPHFLALPREAAWRQRVLELAGSLNDA